MDRRVFVANCVGTALFPSLNLIKPVDNEYDIFKKWCKRASSPIASVALTAQREMAEALSAPLLKKSLTEPVCRI